MKRLMFWRLVEKIAWVLSIGTAITVAAFFIAYWGALSKDESANASALVQAVGSVVAIFVAIIISNAQRKHELEIRQAASRETERSLAARLKFLAQEVTHITDRIPIEDLERNGRLDGRAMLLLDRLSTRLDALDSDVNEVRLELAHQVRLSLTELIYIINNFLALQDAAELVADRQRSLAALSDKCARHFDKL